MTNNVLDDAIVTRAGKEPEEEIYKARWVWYHTIIAVELAFTNLLLLLILVK